mmetsp:Transcript_31503/g.46749  ORF Transcript_31503/g.46749 Transcript_31503/m.46749 type:complete len:122 (-) Transcript_31503:60-425(-)
MASITSSFSPSYPPGTSLPTEGIELNSIEFRQARTAALVADCPCESFPKPHSTNKIVLTWTSPFADEAIVSSDAEADGRLMKGSGACGKARNDGKLEMNDPSANKTGYLIDYAAGEKSTGE